MRVDAMLTALRALPAEGCMVHVRRVTPRGETPHSVFTALHAAGWLLGSRESWRKSRDAIEWCEAEKERPP